MGDFPNIILACCGFGVVCCGSTGIILFMVARTTGIALLMPAANLLSNMIFSDNQDDDENTYKGQIAQRSSSFRDRIRAQSSNFDAQQAAAPQSRFGQQASSTSPQQRRKLQPPSFPNDPFAGSGESGGQSDDYDPFGVPGLRNRPRRDTRRGRFDEREDEVFGGFLDDEGDGFPDF